MALLPTGWIKMPGDNDETKRFAWSHVKSIFYNKAANILLKDKLDEMDKIIDEKIAKALMSNVQVNDQGKIPTSALAYAMQQSITKNGQDIAKLNSDLTDNLNHKKQILPWSNYRDGNYSISNFKFGSNLYIAVGASSKVQKRCSIIAANDSIQIPHPEGFVTIVFNDTNHITVSGTTDNYQLREIRASDLFGI